MCLAASDIPNFNYNKRYSVSAVTEMQAKHFLF